MGQWGITIAFPEYIIVLMSLSFIVGINADHAKQLNYRSIAEDFHSMGSCMVCAVTMYI